MKYILSILFLMAILLASDIVFAQEKIKVSGEKNLKPVACDCDSAIEIPFGKRGYYGPTIAPEGFGNKQEIQSGKINDPFLFEKEHNSAWYYFNVPYDGDLVLEISPQNNKDDYDFLLFKWTDNNFCNNIMEKKIIPVRTNISRTGRGGGGSTGISKTAEQEFFHAGKGAPYSSSLFVHKNEKYYVVLDNVYPEGQGHTIDLAYVKEVNIKGMVMDEDNKPIKAEVTIEDKKGDEIAKTVTDSSGNYQVKTWLRTSENYTLLTFNDSFFIAAREINPKELENNKYQLNDIKTILPKLKGGKKYELGAINFYGNLAEVLPESYSSLNALYKLMQKNKKMIIRIEGHINDPTNTNPVENSQDLSDRRAMTIYDFLLSKNIDKERMSTIGFGSKQMLFPKAVSEEEQKRNRRVEINVISVK